LSANRNQDVTTRPRGASATTILVVDDDARQQQLVGMILRRAGFGVRYADDGDVVAGLVRELQPDLVVLDLKMRRVSGLEALRAIRAAGHSVGVIILTGVGDEELILAAFEAGADDYVTKPFQPRVLAARVNAVLRRAHGGSAADEPPEPERLGDVTLDPLTHHVRIGDRSIALSPTEYELLRTLMHGIGHVFTPADLLARVWGPAYIRQADIVRANIYRLRRKLEPLPAKPRYIRSRPGVGYYFAERSA
jgi:DNA-binding response OmpR family regulator